MFFIVCMLVCRMFSSFLKTKTASTPVEELIRAVRNNEPAEVVRLLDEEDVDVNCVDEEVSLVYCLLIVDVA